MVQFQGTYCHAGGSIHVIGDLSRRQEGAWQGWFFFELGELESVRRGGAKVRTAYGDTWIIEVYQIDGTPPFGKAYFDILTVIP
jgi:hypothetical protein